MAATFVLIVILFDQRKASHGHEIHFRLACTATIFFCFLIILRALINVRNSQRFLKFFLFVCLITPI